MRLHYRLVGYNRRTDWAETTHEIPPRELDAVKQIAHAPESDEGDGVFALDDAQARDIAGVIGQRIDTTENEFFLEPYAEPHRTAHG